MTDGVTTALVLFAFVCVLFPKLIDNRPQYYVGVVLTLAAIVLGPWATDTFVLQAVVAVLQVMAFLVLFLAAGGLTTRGLSSDMMGAFEVVRRGETEKETIIPIGRGGPAGASSRAEDRPAERIDLSAEAGAAYPTKRDVATTPPPPPARKRASPEDSDGPIPME
jgi:hypothetical protein